MNDNAVVADCIKYGLNVGIVAGCLLALGILAMRKNRQKAAKRRPLTLGEALLAKHNRKGISLIEVLMSIFIISIGVLGVAALFPLAHHLANSGAVSDRSATAGHAALRDFKIRLMDSPATWRTANGKLVSANASDTSTDTSLLPLQQHTQRYLLDPRGVASGITQGFPAGGSVAMPRITLVNEHKVYSSGGIRHFVIDNPMLISQANEVFQFQDDLVFVVDDNNQTIPPEQFAERNSYAKNPDGTYVNPPQKRFAARDFSWVATLVRDTPASDYTLSVVVIQGRNAPAAADEVEVDATMLGGGIGGGEVRLTGTATTGPAIERLRNGQWIMLMDATVAAWYRIVNSSEYVPATYTRELTLAGRDWNGATAKAAILPGVIGVCDRTERLTTEWPY